MTNLKYVGNGAWIPGVPARDLTAKEAARFADTIAQYPAGLYVTAGKAQPKAKADDLTRIDGIGPVITRLIIPLVGPRRIESGLEDTFHPQPVPAGYAEAVQVNRLFRASVFKANAEDMAQVNDHLARQEGLYSGVTVPAVFLAGHADRVVFTDRHSIPVAATMPNAELIVREDWGHMLHHTAPDVVADAVRRLHGAGDN